MNRVIIIQLWTSINNNNKHTGANSFDGGRLDGLNPVDPTRIFFVTANICSPCSHTRTESFCSRRADRFEGSCNIVLHRNRTKRSGLGQVVFALPHLTRRWRTAVGRNAKPARTHQQLFRVIDDLSRKIYDSPHRARLSTRRDR